jgi:hypothetical protein
MSEKLNYSQTDTGIAQQPGLVSNYALRIPDAGENNGTPGVTNDTYFSLYSKQWYWMGEDGELKIYTLQQFSGNALWFNMDSLVYG